MNLLRALIYKNEVSFTFADTTEIVREGIRLHNLSPASAIVYGKALSALTYMSSCLKEEKGELSLSVRGDGLAGEIGASGNRALHIRGYIQNPQMPDGADEQTALGKSGSLTVVRDDGYSRPFVGSCEFPEQAEIDGLVEEYYRVSEQLPTRIKTVVRLDEQGNCAFAGVAALQPLPFAVEDTLNKVASFDLVATLQTLYGSTPTEVVKRLEDYAACEEREASYRCHCSRERLEGVLVTLGEPQIREIIQEEGLVRVHCHYCNTDYEFTAEDVDRLFTKKV